MDNSLQSRGCIWQSSRTRQQPVKKIKDMVKKKPEPFDQLIVYFQALIYTYDTKQLYSCE